MEFGQKVEIKVEGSDEELTKAVATIIGDLLQVHGFTVKGKPKDSYAHRMSYYGARTQAKIMLT